MRSREAIRNLSHITPAHRTGDANVRAVWLYTRNGAIGNAAVVLAAGLVAWLESPWPDIMVAVVIGGARSAQPVQRYAAAM
jgi:Co/Zn/Cd efflux system component